MEALISHKVLVNDHFNLQVLFILVKISPFGITINVDGNGASEP
jgi:hypothetical protein